MKLKIGSGLVLPLDAVTETFAILGRRGSGKTHTAVVMAEEMLTADIPVVVIDPLDVWWGLRVSKDGKSPGFPIYVCGGSHADVPLTADAGKVLADAVVDRGLSMVLSLRHLSKSDQRRFVGEFCERLYDRKADPTHRTALHVFIDEADAFVPQRLMPGAERCFGAVDTLVRRGRSSGLAPTLISQRPQVINKDVLSQTEVLVSHQLTGPQDRKALETWIEANDTEDQRGTFMASLASLPKGTAWFWSPGLLGIFKRVEVRDRHTFDSSATPKAGVRAVASPKAFAAVDLEALTAEIQATIEKAKADDPRELRRQIAELEKALNAKATERQATSTPPKVIEKPVLKDGQLARAEGLLKTIENEIARHEAFVKGRLDLLRELTQEIAGAIASTRAPEPVAKPVHIMHAERQARPTPPPVTSRPVRVVSDSDAAVGNGGLRRILIALAQRPEGLTLRQIGVRAGLSSRSGTFSTYMSRGRQQGWILDGGKGGRSTITDAGVAALGDYEPLPTGRSLFLYWLSELGESGAARILQSVVDAYPTTLSLEQIGERANLNPRSGTFSTYLSRLRTLELIESGRGWVKASDELF